MLKFILEFIKNNTVHVANLDVLTETQREVLTAARKSGFVKVENARFTLTPEGKSYLGI